MDCKTVGSDKKQSDEVAEPKIMIFDSIASLQI
jgi:hypothetical protein